MFVYLREGNGDGRPDGSLFASPAASTGSGTTETTDNGLLHSCSHVRFPRFALALRTGFNSCYPPVIRNLNLHRSSLLTVRLGHLPPAGLLSVRPLGHGT